MTTQGCPPDAPYLGRPMKIYGSMKKKRHAIEAARIELLPAFTGEITGSAVIDALPAPIPPMRSREVLWCARMGTGF